MRSLSKKLIFFTLSLFLNTSEFAYSGNPFEIEAEEKIELSTEDYIAIQAKLKEINIDTLLEGLYPTTPPPSFKSLKQFWVRCTRGLRQTLINPEKDCYPVKDLIQVGHGGKNCIVCCVPFDNCAKLGPKQKSRARMSSTILAALEKTGFNGYFYIFKGGFPNPTGKEIRYAGVPYAFKIFMMLEAAKLGFSSVLWIDSACLPINDPTPIFETLELHEAAFLSVPISNYRSNLIFPETRKLLKSLTGVDVIKNPHVVTIVFGLKMDADSAKKIIDQYYQMVRIGLPFLSCFPEEFVLSAIINQPELRHLLYCNHSKKLFGRAKPNEPDSLSTKQQRKDAGYFFYQRKY